MISPGMYFIISSNVFLALFCLSGKQRGSLVSQNTASSKTTHMIDTFTSRSKPDHSIECQDQEELDVWKPTWFHMGSDQ